MPAEQRKAKARQERGRLIVAAARKLAEAEGWEAVTTRKLADKVEYSQPVLYSHFKNMDAIAAAVALEGIEELGVELKKATGLRGLADAYLSFAAEHPALYQAMFVRPTELTFATGDIPPSLRAAFQSLQAGVAPFAKDDTETLTELFWSSLHGLATLQAGSRLRPDHQHHRVNRLIALITG
ncbi:TetR/AcrR family transcriptional regulator [Kribbella sp. NPDC051718]|uniref:TetR/AcrR family transcriptional regulator n=1 Tax=Kribbella sp. NPDC051718 TaxID=3155168 RepID=UPI0034315855